MEKILASPINSYLTADLNSRESGNMEDNIALIKAELLPLKSFVMDELYIPKYGSNQDRIWPIKNSGENGKNEIDH